MGQVLSIVDRTMGSMTNKDCMYWLREMADCAEASAEDFQTVMLVLETKDGRICRYTTGMPLDQMRAVGILSWLASRIATSEDDDILELRK